MMMGERWIGETPVRYYLLAEHLPGGKTDYGLRLAVPDGDSAVEDWLISECHS